VASSGSRAIIPVARTRPLASGELAVRFRSPPDDKHAPRGIYMLFVVTNAGAVADALWVVLQ
jgi:hypothetical protein